MFDRYGVVTMPQSNNGEESRNGGQSTNAQGNQSNARDNQNANAQGTNAQGNANAQGAGGRAANQRRTAGSSTNWLARTGMMTALALAGFLILLFALGQAFDFDLLGLFADAVSSEIGRWLVVAFFALLLIGVAERGLRGALRT